MVAAGNRRRQRQAQDEGRAIEDRRHERGDDVGGKERRVGAQQPEEPFSIGEGEAARIFTGLIYSIALLLAAALLAGQTARPITLVAEVRAALTAHDLTRAEAIVALHSRFSERTRYLRYFSPYPRIPARDLARFVTASNDAL